MFCTWMSQPPLFMRNASWRREAGSPSNPLSTIRSSVPPWASFSSNTTSVDGSLE
jgi:hypothetical protein